jgi:hypothetical protein
MNISGAEQSLLSKVRKKGCLNYLSTGLPDTVPCPLPMPSMLPRGWL